MSASYPVSRWQIASAPMLAMPYSSFMLSRDWVEFEPWAHVLTEPKVGEHLAVLVWAQPDQMQVRALGKVTEVVFDHHWVWYVKTNRTPEGKRLQCILVSGVGL